MPIHTMRARPPRRIGLAASQTSEHAVSDQRVPLLPGYAFLTVDLEQWLARPAPAGPGFLGRVFSALPTAPAQRLRDVATTAQHPAARRRMRSLSRPIRLHLACGFNRLDGWLNIDRVGSNADIYWNLRHPLPLPDGTATAIFHEHILEHLPVASGLIFTRECLRLLPPGGILRVVVPNAGLQMERYARRDPELVQLAPTHLLGAQPLLTGFGHVSLYDAETLHVLLKTAGFASVETVAFGESLLSPCPDSPARRHESVYVEAIA